MRVVKEKPIVGPAYVDPRTGALTLDGLQMFNEMFLALREAQAEIAALTATADAQAATIAAQAATLADHEARITALEP